MKEQWKKIPSFDYEISNRGRVANPSGGILNTFFVSGGLSVSLSKGNIKSTLRVARLVGEAFCPDYSEGLAPSYKDGDPRNPSSKNLAWVQRGQLSKKKSLETIA